MTEEFKEHCKKCKHHSSIPTISTNVHKCKLLNSAIAGVYNYLWVSPIDETSHNYLFREEEECPLYLEYTLVNP